MTTNNTISHYMNNDFSYSEDNVVHGFYYLPSNIVPSKCIFGGVIRFQELKQQFHGLKRNERKTLLQKLKITTIIQTSISFF